ncbi:MAG: HAD-IIIA family hydrolase [Verrucomicrobiota bacterium]|jgi:D-glycero-D-manno-heptose 1,7-bisphosphate phosphatase
MKSGVFFERDGILNQARDDKKGQLSPLTLEEFHLNPEAVELLRQLKSAGFILIATTNQPGLSRGYQSRRDLDLMHAIMMKHLPLDDILVCPHDETDRCPCRKPKPGLLFEAAFKWHLDLDRCFVISNKWQDAQAAHIAGCTSLLIKSPWTGSGHHDFILNDLPAAVAKVLNLASPASVLLART